MNISSSHYADALVLKVEGRLDHETSSDFQVAYASHVRPLAREIRAIVLDLSGLDYISSSGLKALMQLAREAKANQQRLLAAGLQPMIQEIFATAHLGLVMQVFPTAREAIEAVSLNATGAVEAASAPPEAPGPASGPRRVQVFHWFKYDPAKNSSGPHSPRGTREAIERIGALPYRESAMWVDAQSLDGEGFHKDS
jgi:anti-anti-sigma factor